MRIGNIVILPWDRKNFIPRLIVIALAVGWVCWGLVIIHEQRQLQARILERQEQQLRQEEQQRREAAYRQRLMEDKARGGTRNAADGSVR